MTVEDEGVDGRPGEGIEADSSGLNGRPELFETRGRG